VNDLCAIGFDPVFNVHDFAFFADESVPRELLEERFTLRQDVLDSAGAGLLGPIKRALAKRWLRGKEVTEIVQMISQHRPKDVLKEQEKISRSDAIALIAPNYYMHFPAILKGWITRVFTYGFAYTLTADGWRGAVKGRISPLKRKKARIIQPTFFSEEDFEATGLREAMQKTIDMWGFEYPGIPDVQHVYFHRMYGVDENTRKGYLQRAYQLGKEF
jgi:NAD(P)H dehydrogenase (quinone)